MERKRILVVDDEPHMVKLLKIGLEANNYQVLEAYNGRESLKKAKKEKPDLILLDIMMPDLDGYEVCKLLKADFFTSHIPIIMLTVKAQLKDKLQGIEVGADDYITKPFEPEELKARIEMCLRHTYRDLNANPLTHLPGSAQIIHQLENRIAKKTSFALLYLDLDNFKAFNDYYGFLQGDEAIKLTAEITVRAIEELGNGEDFVGHIGGDDFIALTTPDKTETICKEIINNFDRSITNLYAKEDRERGYITCKDRKGESHNYPIMTLSIGVATNTKKIFSHHAQVVQTATELKNYVKSLEGSKYFVDRRGD